MRTEPLGKYGGDEAQHSEWVGEGAGRGMGMRGGDGEMEYAPREYAPREYAPREDMRGYSPREYGARGGE